MKKIFVMCLLFSITIPVIATEIMPKLKIKNTDLKCSTTSFSSKGYDTCTLNTDLIIADPAYSKKYNNLRYDTKCTATFNYDISGGMFGMLSMTESNNIIIWGTNNLKTLPIKINFYSLQPVTKVELKELNCKILDFQ